MPTDTTSYPSDEVEAALPVSSICSSDGIESIDSSNINDTLQRMVERGDWEGIVLTAAQFDGRDSTANSFMSTSEGSSDQ